MDLSPSSDQAALQAATADWCRDNMPLEAARSRPATLWRDIDEMGWVGMTAPGIDMDHATEAVVFAELGRFLAPIALLSSSVSAKWAGTSAKVSLAIPAADCIRLFDSEDTERAFGLFGGEASHIPIAGAALPVPSLDLSASVARLEGGVSKAIVNDPRAALHLQLLAAAFAVGCADAARDMAADYAKVREQFERPIGWFQAIKHMCADMVVRAAVARSQLYYAACALDAGDSEVAFHVAAAKRLADQAALENGRVNIQVHGGIGMTDEAYPHFCLKRAHLLNFIAPSDPARILAA